VLFAYISTLGLPVLYAAQEWKYGSERPAWGPFAEFHPFSNWQTFFFGMCLGRTLQDINLESVPWLLQKAAASVALGMLFSIPFFLPEPSSSVLTLFLDKGPLLLPVFAMLIIFVPVGNDILLRPNFLEYSLGNYLGAMSGHLFLLHWPVKVLLDSVTAGSIWWPIVVMVQFLVAGVCYEVQKALTPLAGGVLKNSWRLLHNSL